MNLRTCVIIGIIIFGTLFIISCVGSQMYLYTKWSVNCQSKLCSASTALASVAASPLYAVQWAIYWIDQYTNPNAPIQNTDNYLMN